MCCAIKNQAHLRSQVSAKTCQDLEIITGEKSLSSLYLLLISFYFFMKASADSLKGRCLLRTTYSLICEEIKCYQPFSKNQFSLSTYYYTIFTKKQEMRVYQSACPKNFLKVSLQMSIYSFWRQQINMISGKPRPPIYRHSISTNAPTLRKCPTQQSESIQPKTTFDRELLVKNNQLLSHLITRSDNMISLKELLDSHYIKEECGRYLLTLDVTVSLRECQQTIYIDNKVDIVKLEQDNRLEDQLTGMKQGYERGLRHCESLLKVLDRKEDFQVAYLNEKKSLENKLRTLQKQIKQVREAKEILEKQLQEEKEFAMEEKQKLNNQISKLQRQISIEKTEAYQARQRSQDISHFYQELQVKYKNLLKQGFKKENADSQKNKKMLGLNKLLTREQEIQRKPQKQYEGSMLQKSWQCQSPQIICIRRQQSKEPSETSTTQTRLFKTFENQPLKELPHNTSIILEKDNNQSSEQANAKRSTL